MKIQILSAHQFKSMPWKNGQGETLELAISPIEASFNSGQFDWRFSIATISQDSDFSPLPGFDRAFAVLEGEGVDLVFADGERVVLSERGRVVNFAGERELRAHLHAGQTRDINLMTRRDQCIGEMWVRPLVGPMVLFVEAQHTWLLFLHRGQAVCESDQQQFEFQQGDLLQLDASDTAARVVVRGGGELVLARLSRGNNPIGSC